MIARGSRGLSSFATAAFRLDTSTQRVHEIDGLRRLALARRLDRLAGLFLFEQFLHGVDGHGATPRGAVGALDALPAADLAVVVQEQPRPAQRDVDPGVAIPTAGLQQQRLDRRVFRKPIASTQPADPAPTMTKS